MMQRRVFLKLVAGGVLACSMPMALAVSAAEQPVRVVYHVLEGNDQASRALANIRNHLRADPEVRIVVVALGEGIRFLLDGATEGNGKPFAPAIAALAARGVEFRICGNSLQAHNVPVASVVPQAVVVPSGVAEVARLQAREGFVYIRP
jgi:uncharacterized protein